MTATRTRLVATVSAAVAALTAAGLLVTPAYADSSIGGAISRAEVMSRAQYWLDHQPGPYAHGPDYPDSAYSAGPGDGARYRRDCSGYVSMAWHLSGSLNTVTLPGVSSAIAKNDLKPGDILNDTDAHAVIFKSWADSAHTRINYYSFGSTPVKLRTNVLMTSGTIDSHPASAYVARRYEKITDDDSGQVQTRLADVTGDGYTDLLATKPDGTLWMYPNNIGRDNGVPYGDATQVGNGWNAFNRVIAADVTGDGYQDLLATKPDGTLMLYPNNIERDNGVPYGDATQVGTGWNQFDRIIGADVTGDGYTDLVATKPDGTMWLYANNIGRDNGHPYSAGTQIGAGWNAFDRLVAADYTGDGFTDLIATKPDGTMWLYPNNIGRDGTPFRTGTQSGHGWNNLSAIL